jgi:hypothetical protein
VNKTTILQSSAKNVTEGKIEWTRRQRRIHKQQLDELKETRRYWIALCGELALEKPMDLS